MLWIVLPARNESAIIADAIVQLRDFLVAHTAEHWRIIVADNGSTDATRTVVHAFATENPNIELLELQKPGKGNAVMMGWKKHEISRENEACDVFLFMDADLATDLRHLPEIIAAIRSGADIAIGSRYLPGSSTHRSALRHSISRVNRWLLHRRFGLQVSDPPCGFKAINARTLRTIVPQIRDRQWFFDTELLIRATHAGYRIVEVPVTW
ncbi:glycosyltransferase, partial [Candidatus Uhrbacteria bacterium]|nr:glycosyltransferase [Candidatus Uhrbacteria bacterium]